MFNVLEMCFYYIKHLIFSIYSFYNHRSYVGVPRNEVIDNCE
jgi:hypothetical protein